MVYIQLEKTDFKILNFLIRNLKKEYSIKELSEQLKKPYVKIHNSIKRLSTKDIVKEEIKGKSHYCSLNYKENKNIICFIHSLRARGFLNKNKKISLIITNIIDGIKFPDYILVLFGSFAKDNSTKNSDIDIAIITSQENKEQVERIINSIKRISAIEIHSLEFSYKDFIEMLKSKDNNVGKEIVKNHIIFKGCEQFYDCTTLAE